MRKLINIITVVKPNIIRLALIVIFFYSSKSAYSFGLANEMVHNDGNGYYAKPGAPGGAIAHGIMAAICIWSFIYFECNYRKPKDQENNK